MIAGRATAEGTTRFRDRFEGEVAEGHFRAFGDLWLSSIGLGTYLGAADDETDSLYEEAILEALAAGCNVFDTSINYRHQRSERALGSALHRAFDRGLAARDEVFVSTKGGFLPFDRQVPSNRKRYLEEEYLASGLIPRDELVAGCHSLAPSFVADQLDRSRKNLGLETIDLYYLHNPEMQLEAIGHDALLTRLADAFGTLGKADEEGTVAALGIATWSGLREPPESRDHLSLEAVAKTLREGAHWAVQLPVNVAMPEALAKPTQELGSDGVVVPPRVAVASLGASLFASASILQGRLATGGLPAEIRPLFPNLTTDAQRALQFTRSAPGVMTAIVGMSQGAHVAENLEVARVEPAGIEPYARMFGT